MNVLIDADEGDLQSLPAKKGGSFQKAAGTRKFRQFQPYSFATTVIHSKQVFAKGASLMVKQITRRNHYNPCFWTALWNEGYYELFVQDKKVPDARSQKVYSLNIRANRIFHLPVNDVHYEKGLGLVKYDANQLIELAQDYLPGDQFQETASWLRTYPGTGYLDFENKWEFAEKNLGYPALRNVIRKGHVDISDREQIITFMFFQRLRSPGFMKSKFEFAEHIGASRLDVFTSIDKNIVDRAYMSEHYSKYIKSQWHVYPLSSHTLPLPDNPVLFSEKTEMVALSPRLLIEINKKSRDTKNSHLIHRDLPPTKLNEYISRCIFNTEKEIIFSNSEALEKLKKHPDFIAKMQRLKTAKGYNKVIDKSGKETVIFNFLSLRPKRRRKKKSRK